MKVVTTGSGRVKSMAPKIVTVQEAAGHLLELIALVEQGQEVVIVHDDQPKVKLVPVGQAPQKRVFGQHRGKIQMSSDFDAPLPEAFWLSGTP
jgi:antitoxin (DNA-binding transcriptional repressor) of toxin-antitoxin stability system